MKAINLKEKLSLFHEHWTPKVIASLDNNQVFLSKLKGDFIWHNHEGQDELFLVVEGRFRMDFRDKQVWLETGEMIVVPAGVDHKPFAENECSVLVIESSETKHTGGLDDPRRKDTHERI